jgi:hypothetical protein
METYVQLKARHEKEINAFPLGACFSKQQFEEMMTKWGLTVNDTDKILSIGYGCYIRKSDKEAFNELNARHKKERADAIAADKTGAGYIYQMFMYELANHEYCITFDLEPTLDALGLTYEEVEKDARLKRGLNKAKKEYLKNYEW